MAMLLTLIRLLAFAVSTMGYVALARVYWKIPARASYIFVLASFACLEYFAGLAGVLPLMAVLLFFGGLFAFTLIILQKKIKIAFNPLAAGDEDRFAVQTPAHINSTFWIPDISVVFSNNFDSYEFVHEYASKNPDVDKKELNQKLAQL